MNEWSVGMKMEQNMDFGWELHPIGGDTGQAYMAVRSNERVFLKRNSSPFLAVLSGEGIAPKLIWTKRAGNGDVLTAQEWLTGRTLQPEEMQSTAVIDLVRQIHQSENLLHMLQRIHGEVYTPQDFLQEYDTGLQTDLRTHQFLGKIHRYLEETVQYLEPCEQTVCHGDLDRRNFMMSKEDRLYLIDWEMVRLADPMSDITSILVEYLPVSGWKTWLDEYGIDVTSEVKARVEWYALINALLSIKRNHLEGRYYEMNEKILLVKTIYQHRLHPEEE